MKANIKALLFIVLALVVTGCGYSPPKPSSAINVCFTPSTECTREVIQYINQAKNSILVQTNLINSGQFVKALANAKQRQVDVNVLLDKTQLKPKNSSVLKLLTQRNIPVWIDDKPAVANNKILVIDKQIVITGSLNFASANQNNNATNLVIIKDDQIADNYFSYWENRQKSATNVTSYYNANPKPKLVLKQTQKRPEARQMARRKNA